MRKMILTGLFALLSACATTPAPTEPSEERPQSAEAKAGHPDAIKIPIGTPSERAENLRIEGVTGTWQLTSADGGEAPDLVLQREVWFTGFKRPYSAGDIFEWRGKRFRVTAVSRSTSETYATIEPVPDDE